MAFPKKGLFSTIFKSDGIYDDLYTKQGASPPTKRMDIRLGEAEPSEDVPLAKPTAKESFFAKETFGLPNWLIGIFLLGFAYMYRKKKAEVEKIA